MPRNTRVLISGASIAGPALAFWLDRYGFDVTVVEKAALTTGLMQSMDRRATDIELDDYAVDVARRAPSVPASPAARS